MQGERELARDNKSLGEFRLSGIPAAPRGVPQIEVSFDIDANGIVHVSAKEKGTGKEQKITITNNTGLAQDEIERMIKDAELHREEDKKKRETIEKKNRLENLIFDIEKTIEENKATLGEEEIKKAEDALVNAKKVLQDQSEDAEALEKEVHNLLQASQKVSELLYKSHSEKSENNQENNSNDESPIDTQGE